MYILKHRFTRTLVTFGLLTGLALVPAQGFQGPPQMPPARVEVTTVGPQMMAPHMDVTATVVSLHDSRIATEVEGPLQWIAETGTAVDKGNVIARIDDRLLSIALRQAKASLARLQADLTWREQNVARLEDLSRRDNVSRAQLEEAVALRDMRRHEIEDARALVERAEGDVARAVIRAPFPGHVVSRLANVGEYLMTGDEVARLVDSRNVEITMPAPIAITPYLKKGDSVPVTDARGVHKLPIKRIVPVGDVVSRMVQVILSPGAQSWVVGAPVTVSLPKDTPREAIAVPRDALVLKNGLVYIYKIGEDMKAEQVRVEVDAAVGLMVALKGGVEAGDRIVIRGGERLQPGQEVIIQDAP